MCRKVKHRSRGAAIAALKAINNAQLNAYRCRACGFWHLGNSKAEHKVQARIDQLLGIR